MRRSSPGAVLLLCSALAAALAAVPAHAQTPCGQDPGGCTDNPPTVSFQNPVYTVTSASYTLTVDYADDYSLNPASRTIVLGTSSGSSTVVTGYGTGNTLHMNGSGASAFSTDVITLSPGSNKLTVSIADGIGQTTTRFIWVTYNAPPPPLQHDTPRISLAPQSTDYGIVEQAGTHASFTTPAYVSLDQPRAVTLQYSSSGTYSRGVVQVDVTDRSLAPPDDMSIRIKAADGSWATPEVFYRGAAGTSRLAASWDMSSGGTGVYSYTAVVRSYWGSTFVESSAAVQVPVVTRDFSTWMGLAPGWRIAGQQRVRTPAPYVMTVVEGDGRVQRFDQDAGGIYRGPAGELSTLHYDGAGNIIRTYPDHGAVYFSATSGEMTKQVDPFGNATVWAYDASWRLLSITDPAGKAFTFGYNASGTGTMATITDPAGRVSRLYYNASADLTGITDPAGGIAFQADYQDAYHRMTNAWDRAGKMTSFAYGGNGFACCVWAPAVTIAGQSTRPYTYAFTPLDGALPPAGKGTLAAPAPRRASTDVFGYVTDPVGNTSYAWFDAWGNLTQTQDPAGQQVKITRDPANGLPTQVVSPTGARVEMSWDAASGALLSRTDWMQSSVVSSVSYHYAPACPTQPDRVSNASGGATWFTLGTKCEVLATRIDSVGGNPTKYTYDSRYRVSTVTDSVTQVATRFARDHNTWMNTDTVTVTSPGNAAQVMRMAYDGYGRTASTTNVNGETASVAYDLLNRVTSTTDPALHVTRTYWGAVFVDSLVDAAGKKYSWTRNDLGWVEKEYEPAGLRQYAYDADGRVTTFTPRNTARPITYTYDNLSRVKTRATVDVGTTTYSYDPAGRWQVVSNPESRDSVQLDDMGRLGSITSTMGGAAYTQRYWYRWTGAIDSVRLETPGGNYSRSFGYSASGFLKTVGGFGGVAASIAYDTAARPKTVTYPGGTVQSLAFNSRGQLYTSTYTKGYNTLWSLGGVYGYDALNRISQRFSIARDTSRSYGYDGVGQLTGYDDYNYWTEQVCTGSEASEVCTNQPRAANYDSRTFTYDAVGNRTDGATLQTNSNRYATFGGFTLEYDADGNVTRKYNTTTGFDQYLTWNSLGQLSGVGRTGLGWVTYSYNGLGQRVRRVDQNNGATIRSLYDANGNLTAEIDGVTGNPLRLYSYYPTVDAPFSMYNVATGTSYYYDTEAPGHVRALFDANGTAVDAYRYTPFGEMEPGSPQEAVTNSLKFMSRELDASTGLYYVRARWYDPVLGRFISEDPVGLGGGINNYAYAEDDPIDHRDPSGLCYQGGWVDFVLLGVSYTSGPCGPDPFLMVPWGGVTVAGNGLPPVNRDKEQALSDGEKIALGVAARVGPVQPWLEAYGTGILSVMPMGGFGGAISGLGLGAASDAVAVGSAGGRIATATVVRAIARGEKVADLVNELAQLTYESGGMEHAIVSTEGGARLIVQGGEGGISFGSLGDGLRRVILHTHPLPAPPSALDFMMLRQLGQRSSWIYGLFGGGLIKFGLP